VGRSGTLSRMHSRGKIRRGKINRDPLRKIIGFVAEYSNGQQIGTKERLECGHELWPREDFIGPLRPNIGQRRRCKFCGVAREEKP
jgi:hypothetical protein